MRETTENMSPAERRKDLAEVLAEGILRLRQIAVRTGGSRPSRTPEESSEIVSYSLEEGANSRPHAPGLKGGNGRQEGA